MLCRLLMLAWNVLWQPKFGRRCLGSSKDLRQVLALCVLCVLPLRTMSAPVSTTSSSSYTTSAATSEPYWVNPCGLSTLDPDQLDGNVGTPPPLRDLLDDVKRTAVITKRNATDAKQVFLKQVQLDERSLEVYRQKWLPEVPPASLETFNSMSVEEAFRKSFEYMQFFAVGLEQILLDQALHEGQFLTLFEGVRTQMMQLLCELQLGMVTLKIDRNTNVLQDVMSHEFRDVSEESHRLVRGYLILRDYIRTTEYIAELFAYLQTKL